VMLTAREFYFDTPLERREATWTGGHAPARAISTRPANFLRE